MIFYHQKFQTRQTSFEENGVTTKNSENEVRLVGIQKQVDELEGRQKKTITEAIKNFAKKVDEKLKFFNLSDQKVLKFLYF